MNEKDKMLSGYLYDCNGDNLLNDRIRAKDLCYKFNSIVPSQVEKRQEIIRELFSKIGEKFNIESDFWCDYGYNIETGNNFYSNHNCVILDCAKVTFGDNVLIGPNCGFYTAGHPLDMEQRIEWLEFAKPITIGDNVWFGGNCVILPGVTIGSNTVIGAGSIVAKDIPSNVLAFGNPCRIIREITQDDKYKNIAP